MSQLLSIITVCRNESSHIQRTCKSIVNQDWQGFEWIVIDGASTDGTAKILHGYKAHMNHFVSEPDNGIYDAMNKGIRLATGDYILFLNGGDALHANDVLRRTVPILGKADVLHGKINVFDESGRFKKVYEAEKLAITGSYFFDHKCVPHPSAFIRRSMFQRFGLYDPTYRVISDRVFFNKLAMAKCSFTPLPFIVSDFFLGGISSHENSHELTCSELIRWRKQCFPFRFRYCQIKESGTRIYHRITTTLVNSFVGRVLVRTKRNLWPEASP